MYHYFFRPIINSLFAILGIIFAINLVILLSMRRRIRKWFRWYMNLILLIMLVDIQKIILMLIKERMDDENLYTYTDNELLLMYWEVESSVVEYERVHRESILEY